MSEQYKDRERDRDRDRGSLGSAKRSSKGSRDFRGNRDHNRDREHGRDRDTRDNRNNPHRVPHELIITLPLSEGTGNYGQLFADLQNKKENLRIQSFSVSFATLDDVFVKVVTNDEREREKKDNEQRGHDGDRDRDRDRHGRGSKSSMSSDDRYSSRHDSDSHKVKFPDELELRKKGQRRSSDQTKFVTDIDNPRGSKANKSPPPKPVNKQGNAARPAGNKPNKPGNKANIPIGSKPNTGSKSNVPAGNKPNQPQTHAKQLSATTPSTTSNKSAGKSALKRSSVNPEHDKSSEDYAERDRDRDRDKDRDRDRDQARHSHSDHDRQHSDREEKETFSGGALCCQRVQATFLKKFVCSIRRITHIILQVCIPLVLIILAILLVTLLRKPPPAKPALIISLDTYISPIVFYRFDDPAVTQGRANYYNNLILSYEKADTKFLDVEKGDLSVEEALDKVGRDKPGVYRRSYVVAASFNKSDPTVPGAPSLNTTSWFSRVPFHSAPLALNLMATTVLRETRQSQDLFINVMTHPLATTFNGERQFKDVEFNRFLFGLIAGCIISLGLSILAATIVIFPVEEKVTQMKHLQLMTGISPATFWLTAFLYDLVIMLLAIVLFIGCFYLVQTYNFFTDFQGTQTLFAIFFCYAIGAISFAYLVSLWASSSARAFAFVVIFHLFAGMLLAVAIAIMEAALDLTGQANEPPPQPGDDKYNLFHRLYISGIIVKWIGRTFPFCGIVKSFLIYLALAAYNSGCKDFTDQDKLLYCNVTKSTLSNEQKALLSCCFDYCDSGEKEVSCLLGQSDCFIPKKYLLWVHKCERGNISGILQELFAVLVVSLIYLIIVILYDCGMFSCLGEKVFSRSNAAANTRPRDDDNDSRRGSRDSPRRSRDDHRRGSRDDQRRGSKDNQRRDSRDIQRRDSRDNQRRDSRDNQRRGSRDNQRRGSRDNQRRGSRDNQHRGSRDNQRRGSRDNQRRGSRDNQRDRRESRDNYYRHTEKDDAVLQEQKRIDEELNKKGFQDAFVVYDLWKFYGEFAAVAGLSFGVHHGECFGLLGVNGAGKTTTFQIVTAETYPSKGNAYITKQINLRDTRNRYLQEIGYCPQFDGLFPVMTGREMLLLFSRLRGGKNPHGSAANWLAKFGLEDSADYANENYSGGMKRRLSTAVSLIENPRVVLLDEPTTGVDPVSRRRFWNIIRNQQNLGQAVVLTSHSMEECEALCSRLGIMVNGQFQCLGAVAAIKGKYGQGFVITMVLRANAERNHYNEVKDLEKHIFEEFRPCFLLDKHLGLRAFRSKNTHMTWSQRFEKGEAIKKKHHNVVEEYHITDASLEEIFLTFARKQYPDRPQPSSGCC